MVPLPVMPDMVTVRVFPEPLTAAVPLAVPVLFRESPGVLNPVTDSLNVTV